jgi:hypothetical protein
MEKYSSRLQKKGVGVGVWGWWWGPNPHTLTPIRLPRFELVKESVAESAVRTSLSEQNEKYFIIYGHLYRKKRKKFITRSKRAGQAINIIYIERETSYEMVHLQKLTTEFLYKQIRWTLFTLQIFAIFSFIVYIFRSLFLFATSLFALYFFVFLWIR